MRNVFIPVEPKAPPPKRRGYPFAGAAPPPVPLTVFKTRRLVPPTEEETIVHHKPNLAWMYASPPPVVPLTVFLRKSAYTYEEEVFPNYSIFHRWNPLFNPTGQLIMLGDGPGGGQLGIPTIIGGKQRLQIFIAGTEVTNPVGTDFSMVYGLSEAAAAQPLRIYSQTIGRGTATFDLYDANATLSIELGQTVLIQEFGIRLFAGCIATLQPELFVKNNGLGYFMVWHVTALDKSSIFDHRVVLAPFYLAGTDAADVIRDLFSNPSSCNPPLSQEGITLNNVPASLGGLTADLVINKDTVTTVMNDIMTDVGGAWWIDTTSDLHAVPLAELGPAPYSLSMTSKNFRKAANSATLVDYRNKQYVVSDRVVEPDGPDISGVAVTETWTLPQALANSLGYLPLSIVTNQQILKITSLTVNGTQQPVYVGTQQPFISFRHTWWYFPQTNSLIPPNIQGLNPFPDPPVTSPDPSPGDVVVINYIAPSQASNVVINDPLAPTVGTCGSGVYEVTEQVKGITKQSDLAAIAVALLAKSGVVPKILTYETDVPGAFVGMALSVDLPPLDLASATLLITTVDGTAQDGILAYGSRFRWQITATNTDDLGNWINWFERFVARTNNGIPLPRLRAYDWVLAPGGSLSGGTLVSTPTTVLDTGRVFKAALQFTTPPVDQDVTVDIISAQQGSILSGPVKLTVPAGSNSLVEITQFTNDPAPFYLYQGDSLSVLITYSNAGAAPVNGANGKLTLQVTF